MRVSCSSNPYVELLAVWVRYRPTNWYNADGIRWRMACHRVCGEDVSIEWDVEGCTVAGAMRFNYESVR